MEVEEQAWRSSDADGCCSDFFLERAYPQIKKCFLFHPHLVSLSHFFHPIQQKAFFLFVKQDRRHSYHFFSPLCCYCCCCCHQCSVLLLACCLTSFLVIFSAAAVSRFFLVPCIFMCTLFLSVIFSFISQWNRRGIEGEERERKRGKSEMYCSHGRMTTYITSAW